MATMKKGYANIPTQKGNVVKVFIKCFPVEGTSVWNIEYYFPIHTEYKYICVHENTFEFTGCRNSADGRSSILNAVAITSTTVKFSCPVTWTAERRALELITILD